MNTVRERRTGEPVTNLKANRTHPRERTGVRFVLRNMTDPSRVEDYGAWYDDYENAIIHPGLIANAFRFEKPASMWAWAVPISSSA